MARYTGAQPRPTVVGIVRIVGTSRTGKREVVWGRPDLSDTRGFASATDEARRLLHEQRDQLERDYHDLAFGYEVLTGGLADAV